MGTGLRFNGAVNRTKTLPIKIIVNLYDAVNVGQHMQTIQRNLLSSTSYFESLNIKKTLIVKTQLYYIYIYIANDGI